MVSKKRTQPSSSTKPRVYPSCKKSPDTGTLTQQWSTHLVEFDEESQNYYYAIVRDEKEAGDPIDHDFQYVCTIPQGIMLFRKRK